MDCPVPDTYGALAGPPSADWLSPLKPSPQDPPAFLAASAPGSQALGQGPPSGSHPLAPAPAGNDCPVFELGSGPVSVVGPTGLRPSSLCLRDFPAYVPLKIPESRRFNPPRCMDGGRGWMYFSFAFPMQRLKNQWQHSALSLYRPYSRTQRCAVPLLWSLLMCGAV